MEHEVTVKFKIEAKDFKDAVDKVSTFTCEMPKPHHIDIEPMPLDKHISQD